MSINIYINSASPMDVAPALTTLREDVSIAPTSSLSIMSPVYVIDYDNGILGANFVYDSAWGRYYWIVDKTVEPGQTMTLHCKNAILANTVWNHADSWRATVVRSGQAGRPTYIPDDQYPIHPHRKNYMSLWFYPEADYALSSADNNYVVSILTGGDPFYPAPTNNNSEEEQT